MWIKSIKVDNFKSLVDFHLDLAQFTCLIGLNGSGKSTVLQCLDFLGQLMRGDLKGWLERRDWDAHDLHSKLKHGTTINFEVRLGLSGRQDEIRWLGRFDTSELRCTMEIIKTPWERLYSSKHDLLFYRPAYKHNKKNSPILTKRDFIYQGSIASQLRDSFFDASRAARTPVNLLDVKRFLCGIRSLDLLSPESLKQRARKSDGSLGLSGERLSAFLHEMEQERREDLFKELREVYPQLTELSAKALRSGLKQLEIRESYGGKEVITEARHINDGMLRLIAILAELQGDGGVAVFDEIENGINPELVEFLIDAFTSAKRQVVATTHSPMILNYLSDDDAKAGVMYLYKTPAGATRAVPFFSIPSLAEKLEVMGPGEAFVDTNLTQLADEIARMPKTETRDHVLPVQRRRGH